ncbi:hypothetical protein GCM10011321_28260 [Youhaiella tibetensis]|uniref:Uncharacterized protein n=1 Tax=Paradevosia tibetensis TaxID=1447062 RepID=A0A5B9DIY1_9HYPH|nr:hypothetical protein [Youhaiella tibetensis]QEE19180.1 hypothetical protein FNA67_02875 [Youhaiella tibetensis]GGF35520.1 hypothetical protein GCM10011321_28260 [Youhaiella tibetensis]
MSIISGTALDPVLYFKAGTLPVAQGSSFDLSVGHIYDSAGKEINGPFVLKPGAMVQVASAEVFNLPQDVTGHVTYKTGLTREGIWALTVGIVDPGWDGPIATTLLNFSRVDHMIHTGMPFLRVTLFQHGAVLTPRRAPPLDQYLREVQGLAAAHFPSTFLDSENIASKAADTVMEKMRNVGLAWFGATAILFAAIQVMAPPLSRAFDGLFPPASVTEMTAKLAALQARIDGLEAATASTRAAAAPAAQTAVVPEDSEVPASSAAPATGQ